MTDHDHDHDHDPTYTQPPVMPSPVESAGGVMQRSLDKRTDTVGKLCLTGNMLAQGLRLLDLACKQLGVAEIRTEDGTVVFTAGSLSVDSFLVENQFGVSIKPDKNRHVARVAR